MKFLFYRHKKGVVAFAMNKTQIHFYELTILLRGSLTYRINDVPVTLNDKDALFLKPTSFRQRAQSTEAVDYISIHFLSDEPIDLPTTIPNAARSFVPALLMCADRLWEEFPPNVETTMLCLLNCLLEYIRSTISQTNENPIVAKLKQYMHANLRQKATVSDIAAQLHFSPSYCNAIFRKSTGYPILTYFTQLRIEEAKTLLLSDEYTLQEIAETLGFEDYNYFSRLFKKHVGLPPSEYKKKFLIQINAP